MIKIATITFHHAHNYGSVLQAYALQKTIKNIGNECGIDIDYKIIDLHTNGQNEIYSVYKKNNSIKNVLKNILTIPFSKKLKERYLNFENFITNNLDLTKHYSSSQQLYSDLPKADIYISGSDQIWNVRAADFEMAYYFDFLPENAYRVSYAVSMGPLMIDWSKYLDYKCSDCIKKYSEISVREENTKKMIYEISGCNSDIHIDPTLLLTEKDWLKVASNKNYNNGKYILFYGLEPTCEQLKIVKNISKTLNLPVVITKYFNKYDYFNSFVKLYDCGPDDFLSLIHNASFVITSSFHGTAFSVLFKKPFLVFDGMKDNRISHLLINTNLTSRNIHTNDTDFKNESLFDIDFSKSKVFLQSERKKSKEYLKGCLNFYD